MDTTICAPQRCENVVWEIVEGEIPFCGANQGACNVGGSSYGRTRRAKNLLTSEEDGQKDDCALRSSRRKAVVFM